MTLSCRPCNTLYPFFFFASFHLAALCSVEFYLSLRTVS